MITSDGSERMLLPTTGLNEANADGSTRRDRRIVARRTQILEAAEVVFAAKGYHGATTREIAQAADVSEGTLYNYFASKRDLFVGLMISRTDAPVSYTHLTLPTNREV